MILTRASAALTCHQPTQPGASSTFCAHAADQETSAGKTDEQEGSLVPNNQHCRVARLDPQGVQLNQHRLQVGSCPCSQQQPTAHY